MSEKIVTAAILVIGDEILSGRTKDRNIGYIAEYLADIGVDLREARVVPDDRGRDRRRAQRAARALRLRLHHRRHRADPRRHHRRRRRQGVRRRDRRRPARPRDHEGSATSPTSSTPARRRMARIPAGAELIDNPVSWAPGFRIGNVIVMAGVPTVMQAMLDCAAKGLETGVKLAVETIEAAQFPRGATATRWRESPPPMARRSSAPTPRSPTARSATRSSCAAAIPRRSPRRAARSRRCSRRSGPTPSRPEARAALGQSC